MTRLMTLAAENGFSHYAAANMEAFVPRADVRTMCRQNRCGRYGASWACPPGCGTLEQAIEDIAGCKSGILVQTTGTLSDEFDYDGMQEISRRHKKSFESFARQARMLYPDCLALTAGICAALLKAGRTGKGDKVSVSLYQTALYCMEHLIASSQYGNPYPRSRLDTSNPFQAAYPTKDGRWIQGGVNAYDKEYQHICRLVGRDDLAEDERFNTFAKVKDNARPFMEELDKAFRQKTADEWVAIFEEADLPFEKEMLWEEILEDPQAWGDHDLARVEGYPENEKLGTSRILVRSPVNFRAMGIPPYEKGPKIGEHTEEILKAAGYREQEIAALRESGSIR